MAESRTFSRLKTVGELIRASSTIYTCPAHFEAEIKTFQVNNLHTAAVDITAKAVVSSSDVPILTTKSIAADAILDVLGTNSIALKASDTLVITAGTKNELNVFLTINETYIG